MPEDTVANEPVGCDLSPERRERVIARFNCGQTYREAARMQWRSEHLEASATM